MTNQPYPVMPPPAAALRPLKGLATAASVLLGLAAAADLFALYAGTVMHNVSGDLLTASEDRIDAADSLYSLAGNLQLLTIAATAVVFLIWFYRARCNAEVFAQDVCTRGRGWAIGAWFIPIGNLWLPAAVAREIWTASAQTAPDGSWREVSRRPLNLWWGTWVGALVLARIGMTMQSNATTPQALQRAVDVTMAADALTFAAALLAIVFVRKLTAMQDPTALPAPATI
ncbi:DUF4328 domain-containing protein [Streptomyces sp. NPDC001941]|uniref:DUF4328 domain-containing protein n=1 Tax=Streptomyces sp. NPDC001941 TaxID=3154659 RepID=UPI003319EE08